MESPRSHAIPVPTSQSIVFDRRMPHLPIPLSQPCLPFPLPLHLYRDVFSSIPQHNQRSRRRLRILLRRHSSSRERPSMHPRKQSSVFSSVLSMPLSYGLNSPGSRVLHRSSGVFVAEEGIADIAFASSKLDAVCGSACCSILT